MYKLGYEYCIELVLLIGGSMKLGWDYRLHFALHSPRIPSRIAEDYSEDTPVTAM